MKKSEKKEPEVDKIIMCELKKRRMNIKTKLECLPDTDWMSATRIAIEINVIDQM